MASQIVTPRNPRSTMLRAILDQICNKWTLLIVATLDQGTLRFKDLHQQIPGISQRMLTLTLRNLERDGLVARSVYAEVPPRVEYALTAAGLTHLLTTRQSIRTTATKIHT